MMKRIPFASWFDVLQYCDTHAWIYYHAPMDINPVVVAVVKVFKNGKMRVDVHGNKFTIDIDHRSRCSRPE